MTSGDQEEAYDETRETFKAFDNSGNDKITVSHLKSVLDNLSVKLTSSELSGIVAELDSVGFELSYSGIYKLFFSLFGLLCSRTFIYSVIPPLFFSVINVLMSC